MQRMRFIRDLLRIGPLRTIFDVPCSIDIEPGPYRSESHVYLFPVANHQI